MKYFGIIFISVFIISTQFSCEAGVVLQTNNNQIICDGFTCPINTVKCIVFERTTPDLASIRHLRECIDANGNAISRDDVTVTNPNPGNAVNNYLESSNSGNGGSVLIQNNQGRDVDPQVVQGILQNAQSQVDYWNQWQQDFQQNLQSNLRKTLSQSLNFGF